MKRIGFDKTSLLVGLLLILTLPACTGVLNDPSMRAGSAITLNDDSPDRLLWNQLTTIYGNKDSLTITGSCSAGVGNIKVDVIPQDPSNPNLVSVQTTCNNGQFSIPFTQANQFQLNGIYTLNFTGVTADASQTKFSISRVYNLYYVPNPSTMVTLQCEDASNSNALIPFTNGFTCVMPSQQDTKIDTNLLLTGACNAAATAHNTQITVGTNAAVSCPSFAQNFSITEGSALIPVTWSDVWGNNYTANVLAQTQILWGAVSFVSMSDAITPTPNIPDQIIMASGMPASVTQENGDSSDPVLLAIPYSRAPASTTGSGSELSNLAPGFLSLIYGLPAGS